MRSAYLVPVLLPLASLVSAGCLEEPPPQVPEAAEEAPPPREPTVVSSVAMARARRGAMPAASEGVPRASDADRIRPAPVFFRLGAGYGAVGQVDLGPCRAKGLDTGYLRMRVTFAGDGTVARATVESPTPPPPAALACVSEQLRTASVPSFEGGDVTLSKSLYVESDTPAQPPASPDLYVRGEDAHKTASR
jgi:hypothetical protein